MDYYIGKATNADVRYRASSGGVGTAIIKYLLQHEYKTAITFVFDNKECKYVPRFIYDIKDINISGAIYHDIDLVSYVKKNIPYIKKNIIITCVPCQVRPLRSILNRVGVNSFIITFACSGQTTIEGTYCYYRFLHIKKEDINYMQYRGNGWPSGIQLELKDGTKIFHENYTEPWTSIHQSKLYRPKRCFYCKMDTDYTADVVLADPWLDYYKCSDNIGYTLFICNTKYAQDVIGRLKEMERIDLISASQDDWNLAQLPNIRKKQYVEDYRKHINLIYSICSNIYYRRFFSMNLYFMRIHNLLIRIIKNLHKQ